MKFIKLFVYVIYGVMTHRNIRMEEHDRDINYKKIRNNMYTYTQSRK